MEDGLYELNFVKTYERFYGIIYRFINKIVYNRELSEDIVQETFAKLFEKGIDLNVERNTTLTFLFKVSKNTAVDYLRKNRHVADMFDTEKLEEVIIDNEFYRDIEDAYISGEVISTLHDTINSFPENEQQIYFDNFFNKKSLAIISNEENISIYQVKKVMKKVNEKIRANLEDFFEVTNEFDS